MSEEDFQELSNAVTNLDQDLVEKLTKDFLSRNIDPAEIIEKGLVEGIKEVGRKYENGEYFLSELTYGASVFNAGYQILEPLLKQSLEKRSKRGIVVLGTVAGDIHSIGKDIVKTMLIAEGFTVHDLGVDVPLEKFIEAIKHFRPDIVGASALLSTTIARQRELIEKLKEEGLRDKVKVVVGGAAVTDKWASQIGADGYGPTAAEGIRRIIELVSGATRQ